MLHKIYPVMSYLRIGQRRGLETKKTPPMTGATSQGQTKTPSLASRNWAMAMNSNMLPYKMGKVYALQTKF